MEWYSTTPTRVCNTSRSQSEFPCKQANASVSLISLLKKVLCLQTHLVAARNELDRRVDKLESVRPSVGLLGIVHRRELANLPLAVHLIAESPKLDVVGLVSSGVLAPEVGPVGVARAVAVLDPRQRLLVRSRSHCKSRLVSQTRPTLKDRWTGLTVQAQVGLDSQSSSVVDELVRAELVGLCRQPGELGSHGSVLDGADSVLPVVIAVKGQGPASALRSADGVEGQRT